jgi:molybdate transport system substrate-binding protein
MIRIHIFTILFTLSLTASQITVAVAANVGYAISDLKKAFLKDHPETDIRIILGSSGKLTAQIKNGAPYGLFMSADMKYPKILYTQKIAITKPRIYAKGVLALFSVKKRDFSSNMDILKSSSIRRIAIANPNTAPYGKAAYEALANSGLLENTKSKLVFAESISQTVSYAMTAADVAFVSKSSLYSRGMKQFRGKKHWTEIDPKLYSPIEQGIVLLKNAENKPEYQAFYDFVLSREAEKIFTKYGYRLP